MSAMQNYVDTYLRLLPKRSAGAVDSCAGPPNLDSAALAANLNSTEVNSAGLAEWQVAGNVDVFMVEDDPTMIDLVRSLLKAEGFGLLAVQSFYEAMRTLRQTAPRLLLVDLGLPDGSGMELARIVRGWNYVPRIPVVALTASPEKAGVAWRAGFSGFIPKPFDSMTFRNMVRGWLSVSLNAN
jgi:CheY-like chemotaxis protein